MKRLVQGSVHLGPLRLVRPSFSAMIFSGHHLQPRAKSATTVGRQYAKRVLRSVQRRRPSEPCPLRGRPMCLVFGCVWCLVLCHDCREGVMKWNGRSFDQASIVRRDRPLSFFFFFKKKVLRVTISIIEITNPFRPPTHRNRAGS